MSDETIGRIDLHTHSTASDGKLPPSELVQRAVTKDISVLALTDHDSVAGIAEAWSAARQLGISFVPGIELSTAFSGGECHILGYYLDTHCPVLQQALLRFQQSRISRGQHMVAKLRSLGFAITWDRVQELAQGGTVTRTHIAEALLETGQIDSRQEVFDRYIGHHGLAYVQRDSITPTEAVALIRKAHGVPVLAHPTFVEPHRDWNDPLAPWIPWPFLEQLQAAGLLGLEAYYGEYGPDLTARFCSLAEHYGLIVTGGSDFHADGQTCALGSAPVPPSVVDPLRRLARSCGSPWLQETTATR